MPCRTFRPLAACHRVSTSRGKLSELQGGCEKFPCWLCSLPPPPPLAVAGFSVARVLFRHCLAAPTKLGGAKRLPFGLGPREASATAPTELPTPHLAASVTPCLALQARVHAKVVPKRPWGRPPGRLHLVVSGVVGRAMAATLVRDCPPCFPQKRSFLSVALVT